MLAHAMLNTLYCFPLAHPRSTRKRPVDDQTVGPSTEEVVCLQHRQIAIIFQKHFPACIRPPSVRKCLKRWLWHVCSLSFVAPLGGLPSWHPARHPLQHAVSVNQLGRRPCRDEPLQPQTNQRHELTQPRCQHATDRLPTTFSKFQFKCVPCPYPTLRTNRWKALSKSGSAASRSIVKAAKAYFRPSDRSTETKARLAACAREHGMIPVHEQMA